MYNAQPISQAFFQNFSFYLQLSPEFAKNVMRHLSEMTKTEFDILYEFLKLAHDTKRVELAQETIARRLRVCRETVNRLIAKLEKWGLIDSRGHLYEVRRYRVNCWFLIPAVRLMLMKVFPALALNIQRFQKPNITPIKSLSYLFKNIRQSTSRLRSTKKENQPTSNRQSSKKERREISNTMIENRTSIDQVKSLKLTKWGKLRLQSFHDDAIRYADENFDASRGHSFNSFVATCKLYSQDHGLPIDWKLGYDLTRDMPKTDLFAEKTNLRTSFLKQSSQTNHTDHPFAEEYDRNFPKRGNSNQSTKIKPFQPVEEVITTAELEEDLNNFTALKNAKAFLNQPAINGQDAESYFNRAFQNRQTRYVPHMTNPVEIADRKPIPDVSWIVKAWLDDKEMEVGRYGLERFIHRLEAQIILELHKAGREDARYKVIAEMRARFRYHEDVK